MHSLHVIFPQHATGKARALFVCSGGLLTLTLNSKLVPEVFLPAPIQVAMVPTRPLPSLPCRNFVVSCVSEALVGPGEVSAVVQMHRSVEGMLVNCEHEGDSPAS